MKIYKTNKYVIDVGNKGHVKKDCRTNLRNVFCKKCKSKGHSKYQCRREIECFLCKKKGHISRDCKVNQQKQSDTNAKDKTTFFKRQNNVTIVSKSEGEFLFETDEDLNF